MVLSPDEQVIDPDTGLPKNKIGTQPVGPKAGGAGPELPPVMPGVQPPSDAPALPRQAGPSGPSQAGWDANRVGDYFKSKGVTPFSTSPDYWAGKWNEWGSKDPEYFQRRLDQADEFTNKGPDYNWQAAGQRDPGNTAGGGFWDSHPTAGGGSPGGGPGGTDSGGPLDTSGITDNSVIRQLILSLMQGQGGPAPQGRI